MAKRKLSGIVSTALWWYILAMGIFHLYTAMFGAFEAYLQRAIHLTWVLPMVFVTYPMFDKKKEGHVVAQTSVAWYDWILAVASVIPGIYIVINYYPIVERMVGVDDVTMIQLVLGTIILLALIEATRRVVGMPIVIVCMIFLGYCTYYLMSDIATQNGTGIMANVGFYFWEAYKLLIEEMFLTDEGIYSSSLGVSATIVMIFLIFGGFLENSGIGEYFMEFAQALTGTQIGGSAKIATISAGLFGAISGSAVAIVYAAGTFTVPMMKKTGYDTYEAGAIMAVASTGGQIMPPIMGAGAFVMAGFLNVPFVDIIVAAIIPALLYYGAILIMIHLIAKRDHMRGLNPDELPSRISVLKRIYLMSPIALLVVLLLMGKTAQYAALCGCGTAWLMSLTNPKYRMGPKGILKAIHDGSTGVPVVCTACASAGLVIGSVSLSGIGPKIVGLVLSASFGIPFITLLLIAVVCLILGMGLPATSAYILAASLGVPALSQLSFTPIASHMFVFYYAIISCITPPVALAAYAAASLTDSDPNRMGWAACRWGAIAFVIPLAFCYDNGLLLQLDWVHNCISIISGVALIFGVGFCFVGYCGGKIPTWLRALFGIFAIVAIMHNPVISMASSAAVLALYIFAQKIYSKKTVAAV